LESEITYLLAQGELGGFEIVLPKGISNTPIPTPPPKPMPPPPQPPPPQNTSEHDSVWKNADNIADFYLALQKHSLYNKSARSSSFVAQKEAKINAEYLLLFHSPQELTGEAKEILERLFKKLDVDLNSCAMSFFFKCNATTVMPREKAVLKEMLCKEIEFINPKKIIFFRETPELEKTLDGAPITFAGKPAITLYSLLEMLSSKPDSKQKMIDTWNSLLPKSGWF
jgi:hypothetical protein